VKRRVGVGFWLELTLASVTAFLAVLTLVWHDWIEGVFGFDPDHHNGSFEWELVVVCCVVSLVAAYLARREWRSAALASDG
jgi:hypothetical protein